MENKVEAKTDKNKTKDKKNSILVVSILVCIAMISFVGIGYQMVNGDKQSYVALNSINTSINSSGKEHKISLKVSLGGISKDLKHINTDEAQSIVQKTVETLDYEKLVAKNGTEYLKATLLENLKAQFGDKIENVTLDSILTDVSVGNTTETSTSSREDYLKGISWSN